MTADENLQEFLTDFPVVAFIGNPKLIDLQQLYEVDSGVQLVCKYLKRFDTNKIDILYRGINTVSLKSHHLLQSPKWGGQYAYSQYVQLLWC